MRRRTLHRRGFTLIELLVVFVVVAALAAVLVPSVLNRIRESEASTIASSIDAVREGILEYRADVRRYPTHIRYLTTVPGSAVDICGRNVPASFLSNWKGPYLTSQATTAGIKVVDATVLDSLARSPATFTASTNGELQIRVQDVDSAVARDIERDVDGTLDFNAGTIRWADVAGGRGILRLIIPARGC